jgi:hypothetical protein
MKELSDVINSQVVDLELLNSIKRGDLFLKKSLDGSETGQTIDGDIEVLGGFKAKKIESDGDINSLGLVGVGVGSDGNSSLKFNNGGNTRGALVYDNSELNIKNAFKLNVYNNEKFSILHSGNTKYVKKIVKNLDINSIIPTYKDVISIQDGDMEDKADYELIIFLNYSISLLKRVPIVRYTLDGSLWYNLNIEPSEYKSAIVKTLTIPIEQVGSTLNFKLQMTRSSDDYTLVLDMAKVVIKKGV